MAAAETPQMDEDLQILGWIRIVRHANYNLNQTIKRSFLSII